MKNIFLTLLSFAFLTGFNASYATHQEPISSYLEGLDDRFMACTSVLRNQNSTNDQIQEAKEEIEELACAGNLYSFKFLWNNRKANASKSQDENKAEFVRDFLANSLHIVAIGNIGNELVEYQKDSPIFLSMLQNLVGQDSEQKMIDSKLKLALGLGYTAGNEPNKHTSLWKAWHLLQDCGNMEESHSGDFNENAYMIKAYQLLFTHSHQSNHIQLIDHYAQHAYSNPLMPHADKANAAFMSVFQHTDHMERLRSVYRLTLTNSNREEKKTND